MKWIELTTMASCATLAACAGAPVPQDELTSAKAAVRAAEVGEAREIPKARLHLKYATDQIAFAERMIDEGYNKQAKRTLHRAEVDAEYALTLARHEEAREESQRVLDRINQLKGGVQ